MRTSVSLSDELASYVDEVSSSFGENNAEAIREALDHGRDAGEQLAEIEAERDRLAERVEELEAKVDSLEARNRDLTNQLAESNRRIDGAAELVEYVEEERSLAQRREEREKQKDEAGVLKRAKWWLVGMPSDSEG